MVEGSQTGLPMVTLLPIVVGNALSCALCFATWTMQLSWMLLFAPILMLLTSPTRHSLIRLRFADHSDCRSKRLICTVKASKVSARDMRLVLDIPRNTAPYHTDELLPKDTSPIIEELGATKMSSAS